MVSSPEEYEAFVERLAEQTRQYGEEPETIATKSIVSLHSMGDCVITTSAGLDDVVRVYPKDVLVNHSGTREYDRRHDTLREIAVDVLAADIREELRGRPTSTGGSCPECGATFESDEATFALHDAFVGVEAEGGDREVIGCAECPECNARLEVLGHVDQVASMEGDR